jgi:hypothetical protein
MFGTLCNDLDIEANQNNCTFRFAADISLPDLVLDVEEFVKHFSKINEQGAYFAA